MVSYQEQGCLGSLVSLLVSLALFALALSILLLIVLVFAAAFALFLLGRLVIRRYVMPQFFPATAVFAEQRLFGAPPDSQLFSAYDYWLMCLERATGLSFTQTPGQLLVGSILISLAPALVIGVPLALVAPAVGSGLLALFTVVGVLFGGLTGYRLGQPAPGWFQSLGSVDGSHDIDQSGFVLGDEEW